MTSSNKFEGLKSGGLYSTNTILEEVSGGESSEKSSSENKKSTQDFNFPPGLLSASIGEELN